jgi:hypothetical protein
MFQHKRISFAYPAALGITMSVSGAMCQGNVSATNCLLCYFIGASLSNDKITQFLKKKKPQGK